MDIDIVKQIEEILRTKLPRREKAFGLSTGYTLSTNGAIEDISLVGLNKSNFEKIIFLLREMESLKYLRIAENGFVDINPLSELTRLEVLSIPGNNIEDISALKALVGLRALNLSRNVLKDISALEQLSDLRELYLSDNKLSDLSHLKELKKLEALSLKANKLQDISVLTALFNLKNLDLSTNNLTSVAPLENLKELEVLGLNSTNLQDVSVVISLENLKSLNLASNNLTDVSLLKKLKKLEILLLAHNNIKNLSFLSSLRNLRELNLSKNAFRDTFPISNLENLNILKLNKNELVDISHLSALNNLTELQLSDNEISNIYPLSALENLVKLDLSDNKVYDISPLEKLKKIKTLNISGNKISDISSLEILLDLENLHLFNNQIRDISSLRGLKKLKTLVLARNKIADVSAFSELKNLKELHLGNNELSDITSFEGLRNIEILRLSINQINDISPLKGLENLRILNLSENQIVDISALEFLRNLTDLILRNNPITELPTWICNFKMGIVWSKGSKKGQINFYKNPLTTPPPEIVKQGKKAVKNYFEQLKEQEEDYLFEAKLLIVGEPGAGKTSLSWKVENSNCELPDKDQTTRGIDVRQYYFPLTEDDFTTFEYPEKLQNRSFRLNLWDFGGQEIYKATHRFFLSKRSLYALVADTRNEDTDFNYWLHIVEMFGGESPLLIILNEKYQRKRNLDIAAMQQRFTNITQVLDVDFADKDKTRLDRLLRAIRYYAIQLPHIGSRLPAKWTDVRESLENDRRNTITLQDYLKICRLNGIKRYEDALVLSQYFHDIGVFLHFQEDSLLMKTIFLKPNWATNAVYKILDHDLLNRKDGQFNKDDTRIIWHEDEFDTLRDELLQLMGKFFLAYEIDHSGEYIVPERLPAIQPTYSWDEQNNLLLRYSYDFFMPKGIMSQFIVEMHQYIYNHNLVWKRGVILERENTMAEVTESYDARTIKIKISGKNCRDFMTIITERFDQIHMQYNKLKVDKLIPCNCEECQNTGRTYFYLYKDLKRRIEKGRQEVECGNSYKMVNVRSLIDEVISPKRPYSLEKERPLESRNVTRTKVFVSYSHKDSEWLKRVQVHLQVLENLGITVNLWDDTQIKPGMKWRNEIEDALSETKVAILLISTDFLASSFIRDNELPPLLKAAEIDGATILPIIIKPSLYENHPHLSEFQSVNKPSEPLSSLTESKQEETFVVLAKRVIELIQT